MTQIIIKKSERVLEVYDGERLIKSYGIALGFCPAGDKEIEGDGKTPEGDFYVFTKNPRSKFHLSLGISYPSLDDATRGVDDGLITENQRDEINKAIRDKNMPPQKTALGGEIYIHGGGVEGDWTDGCVALRNEQMEELYDLIPVGTAVKILA